ncbi:uncharacterized protein LOC106666821 isoform X2 [Cimex lectularius]|uniref:Replication factor A protein 3 n=1 Tax=Cimex lectularius TaxID=79782 RepID=A0A8I6RXH5_CIMLE|nr:uncharacterized protein LOC106666821 isoform X2 [Cimex lectularius]
MATNVTSEVRIPVNGRILAEYVGKKVTIFGTILQTNKSGLSFNIETTDKRQLTVSLRKPLVEPVSGVVEVHGIVKAKDHIVCDYYIAFPGDISESFDNELVNQTVSIIHSTSNAWKDAAKAESVY